MYSFDAIVRYSETHGRQEANAATIANYFQDCAIFDSEQAGIGIEYLKDHNRAWFLGQHHANVAEEGGDDDALGDDQAQ